jgi:hypothetical protein
MPHYPLPVPTHVLEAVDEEDRPVYGARWITQRAKHRAAIQNLFGAITTIYESGTPFFTKDSIQDLVRQIDESGVCPVQTEPVSLRFSVAGIDGKKVDVPLELGVRHGPWPDKGDGVKLVSAMLDIEFRPVDRLTSVASLHADEFEPDKAFLSMVVQAETVPVRLSTGEVVQSYPTLPPPEVRAILHRQKAEWDGSEARRHLLATLETLADAGSLPPVDKVVAFPCWNPSDVERARG